MTNRLISAHRRLTKAQEHQERLLAMREAIAAGEPYSMIGRRFGITRERVRQIAKKHGLGGGLPAIRAKRAKFVEAIEHGMDTEIAAVKFGYAHNIAVATERRFEAKRRRENTRAALMPQVERVKAGESIWSASGNDHGRQDVLRRECKRLGVRSKARTRWSDFSLRRKIVIEGRAAGRTWAEITGSVVQAEGKPCFKTAVYNWARSNIPKNERNPPPTARGGLSRSGSDADGLHGSPTSFDHPEHDFMSVGRDRF